MPVFWRLSVEISHAGKTELARLLFRFYKAYGVLRENGQFVERNGTEMKGQTVGSSGATVRKAVQDALGGTHIPRTPTHACACTLVRTYTCTGCLFIDEASLSFFASARASAILTLLLMLLLI